MEIQKNVLLAPFTTFGIGGFADDFVIVRSIEELIEAVGYAKKNNLEYFVLGKGANILIGDKGFRGLVIKNEARHHSESGIVVNGKILLTVESGAVMSDLIEFTAKNGLSGFEHYAGIPSTVGGALWQNLHFLSPDRSKTMFIGDILESAEILTKSQHKPSTSSGNNSFSLSEQSESKGSLQKITVNQDYFQFGYDTSILHSNHEIVLSATFTLDKKPIEEIQKVIDENLKWREEKHPENATSSSAGSVFRKIDGYGAGRLIEQVGLKGYQIGGAKISEKHANFIINTGNATAKDVRDLIELVGKKVKEELGLEMIPEISMIGEF